MIFSGIQQVGIGVPDVHEAWEWYRKIIGMDVPIFEEAAEANLMLPYTGGKPHKRHAVLAVNMNGGGGFEIWQYTSRTPEAANFEIRLGDLGITIARLKSKDVKASYTYMKSQGVELVNDPTQMPDGRLHYFFKDPYGNIFEVVEYDTFFASGKTSTGGPVGAIMGVSNLQKSKQFYKDVLGFDEVVYEGEGKREDFKNLPRGNEKFEYCCLRRSNKVKGAFSPLLGPMEIELIAVKSDDKKKIYENRFWGDLGFIHMCFDVNGMQELKQKCEAHGHPFTVDSANSFDMGEAAGHFTYIEDPDGALIEFVETHKIPIMKKLGWYLNLQKRNPEKPLPRWMLKALSLNRKKD